MNHDEASHRFNDLTDLYEILDLKPDASAADIREAYFRAKATYQKDNVALYTLIDGSEREEMLARIEEAYQVLSNPDRRRDYDRMNGQMGASPFAVTPVAKENAKVISIDRTSPMESSSDELLVPPKTDTPKVPDFNTHFAGGHATQKREPSAMAPLPTSTSTPPPSPAPAPKPKAEAGLPAELEKEIREQTDWSGNFLRRVREARGVSIEEVTLATKITKPYILAIEEENYSKLPAAVFIRGFVGQLARLLKLPHQQVSASYMARLQRANPEKFK